MLRIDPSYGTQDHQVKFMERRNEIQRRYPCFMDHSNGFMICHTPGCKHPNEHKLNDPHRHPEGEHGPCCYSEAAWKEIYEWQRSPRRA